MRKLLIPYITIYVLLFLVSCTRSPGDIASSSGGGSEQGNALTGIVGQAIYPNGIKVAGAIVTLHPQSFVTANPESLKIHDEIQLTDSEGIYHFSKVATGTYFIKINDQHSNASLREIQKSNEDTLIRLSQDTLTATGSIKGNIIVQGLEPGMALYSFHVVVCELGLDLICNDLNGQFLVSEIPHGTYTIRVQPPNMIIGSQIFNPHDYAIVDTSGVEVKSGDTSEIGTIFILRIDSLQMDSMYQRDTLAIRAILDSNGIDTTINAFTFVRDGRIISFVSQIIPIHFIPDAIGDLTCLEYLFITGRGLAGGIADPIPLVVSNRLAELNSLKHLVLNNYNGIPLDGSLDSTVFAPGKLKSLEVLQLRNDWLVSFPPWIFNLVTLNSLDLSHNVIGQIPGKISELNNLVSLNMSYNAIDKLPPEIKQLQRLNTFNLERCNLITLPMEIVTLNCRIEISNNCLCSPLASEISEWVDTHFCLYLNCDNLPFIDWRQLQNCN